MKTFSLKRAPLTVASLLLAGAIGTVGTIALTHVDPVQARTASADAPETVTVFIDAHFGMRKDHLAGQLTRSHADFAARGYRYVDMAPYNENGDLVGVFVTYSRR
ncbi:MAG: hypothetical protein ABT19_11420 [Rhodanobacter sp. SCN 68-63]|nr:MAG: hypothetical protein ABT19_11420 [Rhodanobacter sp. SCN 68-63]